ncbi:peptide chain release factor 1 [Roseomonas gilardii subsp. gilardii]|uniref:peptide chain release factor 1 n=1 Tax=Roseomonas gilardii TaxID=257708 RepID=UPI001FFAA39C|nr:peptide chain release factor 1 [Roseomonas gilardii]UPG71300.1 peptide chain release factor 1 [Roseomonas gilardii subsp. gilardii]
MTDSELENALEELDRLINDPEIKMDPDRVWNLLAQLRAQVTSAGSGGHAMTATPAISAGTPA